MKSVALSRLAPGAGATLDDRTIEYLFSDQSVARDGDTIATAGWELDDFLKNPVFLWAHDASSPPIGRVTRVGPVGVELRGAVSYATRDEYPFADTIYRLVKGGFVNATSVSWLPIEWRYSTDKNRPGGVDFLRQTLLEVSQVPVPALPTALAAGRAAGIDVTPFIAWAERQLDTRNSTISRRKLQMVRAAAGAPVRYAMSGHVVRSGAARPTIEMRERAPFKNFGEFLDTVRQVATGAPPDGRLARAPTGLGEVDPTAGGFLVPDVYAEQLIGSVYEEAVLAPLCDRRETDRPNNAQLPAIDETSRADGSRWGGVLSYWAAEGVEPNATLPKFKAIKFNAAKLIALCVASEELIQDVPLLDGHIRRAFAAEGAFQLDKAILFGTGAGVPWGIARADSPATIQVAKESGQVPGTIVAENIANMWSRLPAPCRKRAVWIANEDAEAQLDQVGASASPPSTAALYMPRGANGNEFPLVKGRPLIIAEQCPALGALGDFVLADLSQYVIVDGGLRSALSLEVDFLSFQGVFRFVLRVDGKSPWRTPITPYNGGATRSPFVALAAR